MTSILKKIWRKWAPNPFESILKSAVEKSEKRFLIAWNRGLGDVALGLYALTYRIREVIPDAEITFLTRADLKEGFSLLEGVNILASPTWKRGVAYDVSKTLTELNRDPAEFDCIISAPDPTYWVRWQLGTLTPKLRWKEEWDCLWKSFPLHEEALYIALQPQTETGSQYGYEKNWPSSHWQELIQQLSLKKEVKIILFGQQSGNMDFLNDRVIDLRGRTSLLEMLSIIKNRCQKLIVPDSGILSLSYFLDVEFPLEITSLWADPNQGVLKQSVASPNPALKHQALVAREGDLRNLNVKQVLG